MSLRKIRRGLPPFQPHRQRCRLRYLQLWQGLVGDLPVCQLPLFQQDQHRRQLPSCRCLRRREQTERWMMPRRKNRLALLAHPLYPYIVLDRR